MSFAAPKQVISKPFTLAGPAELHRKLLRALISPFQPLTSSFSSSFSSSPVRVSAPFSSFSVAFWSFTSSFPSFPTGLSTSFLVRRSLRGHFVTAVRHGSGTTAWRQSAANTRDIDKWTSDDDPIEDGLAQAWAMFSMKDHWPKLPNCTKMGVTVLITSAKKEMMAVPTSIERLLFATGLDAFMMPDGQWNYSAYWPSAMLIQQDRAALSDAAWKRRFLTEEWTYEKATRTFTPPLPLRQCGAGALQLRDNDVFGLIRSCLSSLEVLCYSWI